MIAVQRYGGWPAFVATYDRAQTTSAIAQLRDFVATLSKSTQKPGRAALPSGGPTRIPKGFLASHFHDREEAIHA